jgi:hypothetical protein
MTIVVEELAATLPLDCAFAGSVATTVDLAHPVVSSLQLALAAPPGGAWPAGAISLTFPWGSGPGCLCGEGEASAIVVTPDAGARDWSVVRGSAPGVGIYWTLTPPAELPAPGSAAGFTIGNIISPSPPDLAPTRCFATCALVDGGDITATAAPAFWRSVPLAITSLESVPAAPTPGGAATLRWAATGAAGCSLEPDEHDLPPSGELAFRTDRARTFRLVARATDGHGTVSRRLRVPLASGWTQLTRHPVVTGDGPILLRDGAGVVCLEPHAGTVAHSRDGRTWHTRSAGLPDRFIGAAGCRWRRGLALTGGVPASTALAWDTLALTADDRGEDWTTRTQAAGPARSWHGCAAYGGLLWLVGGRGAIGDPMADVRTSPDGTTWTATATPAWSARIRPGLAVHGGALWLSGGLAGDLSCDGPGATAATDVWRLGFGQTWVAGPAPPWTGVRAVTVLVASAGRLYALLVPIGEAPIQLWALHAELHWEQVSAAAPVRTDTLIGLRLAATAFGDGLLVVTDAGAWWWGPPSERPPA